MNEPIGLVRLLSCSSYGRLYLDVLIVFSCEHGVHATKQQQLQHISVNIAKTNTYLSCFKDKMKCH